jgi:hypothetical protein
LDVTVQSRKYPQLQQLALTYADFLGSVSCLTAISASRWHASSMQARPVGLPLMQYLRTVVLNLEMQKVKTLIAALALAASLIIIPAFIQSAGAALLNDVIVGGKSIGQDPDANVRLQLRRDSGSENF